LGRWNRSGTFWQWCGGGIWAAILQWTQIGRFLALRRTWLTVVIGVGVTLLIALPILGLVEWFKLLALFGLASLGIILRSVWNEWQEMEDWLGHEDPGRQ